MYRLPWNDLQYVPVFDYFPVFIKSKDIDSRIIIDPWPLLMAMQNDEIPFCNCTLEVNLFTRELRSHALEIVNESRFAIGNLRIVLNINITDICLNCFSRFAAIEHHVVKCLGACFVLVLQIIHCRPSHFR